MHPSSLWFCNSLESHPEFCAAATGEIAGPISATRVCEGAGPEAAAPQRPETGPPWTCHPLYLPSSYLLHGVSQASPGGPITCYLLDLGVAGTANGLPLDSHFPGTSVSVCPFNSVLSVSVQASHCPVHRVAFWLCCEFPEEAQPCWCL